MKLGLEVDPQADHPPLGSDRNQGFISCEIQGW